MFEWLDHGPLMDESGDAGGGGGVAVAEPSSDFSADAAPATDGQVHDAEFVDPGTEGAPVVEEPSTALVTQGERPVQGGKLTPTGRAVAEAVRALNPGLAQTVTQALLTRDYFLQQFPGGKREVTALKALAEQHGGEQGIGELMRENQEWQELDGLYLAGNPGFIERITDTEESQQAFLKAMPHAMEKYRQLGNEHFEHLMSKEFARLMDIARVEPVLALESAILNRAGKAYGAGNFEMAASFLAEIIENYNLLHGFIQEVYARASKAPAAPGTPGDPKLEARASELTKREQALQKQEWEGAVNGQRKAIFAKAWSDVTKGRTITSDQESKIKTYYEFRINAKEKVWDNQSDRFVKNGDRDGYLKEQVVFFRNAIPEALRETIADILPAKPGPKPAAGPVKPPVNGVPQNGTAVRIAKMPAAAEFDMSKMTESMLRQNQGYLKDGRLVQWA